MKKFDFVIGNPPYNDDFENSGDNGNYGKPVYNDFIDDACKIANTVEMIHPARFLFNAGGTPKAWNKKMLEDPHYKVLYYEQNSSKVFPETDIKGGIAITYHNDLKKYAPINVFTSFSELNSIMRKVESDKTFQSISEIVITRTAYRLTDKMHKDHPEAITQLSDGHAYDMSTNIFERLPQLFLDTLPQDAHEYIQIYGRENNKRTFKYIRKDYVNHVINLDKWKVFVPKSNGSGAIGEVLTSPLIGEPLIGNTESFISIGILNSKEEAESLLKYIKTKFSRCMLGILKITQDNPPERWKYVPLQDFTSSSDIDWSKSIPGIDKQLYKKYGLDDNEINFIETHVKEME